MNKRKAVKETGTRGSRLASGILRRLPPGIKKRWDRHLESTFRDHTVNARENRIAMEEFQLRQIAILYRGFFLFIVMVIFLSFSSFVTSRFIFRRNLFGQGEKEIRLKVDYEGKKEEISLLLEERKLTAPEEKEIMDAFFRKLAAEIKGDNLSLRKVNKALDFKDRVDGYPFSISYEPQDSSLISWDGKPGEKALALGKGEKIRTWIRAEASYKDYSAVRQIGITLIPPQKVSLSPVQRFQEMLARRESSSRNREDFIVDSAWEGVSVKDASRENLWKIPPLILAITLLLVVMGHTSIREREQIRHKQNMQDFPLIVHLLTLYMGVGLSFPSAVSRICSDYEKRRKTDGERYAFDQIRLMDHSLHMGLRPMEVCLEWGEHFRERAYARFAMLLSQSFSKGAKELRFMMEKEQEDAFRQQIDFVRKEGEEASTRLVFPMVALLFIIMALIMFPAFMQFYGM